MRRSLAAVAVAMFVLTALPRAQDRAAVASSIVKRDRVDFSGRREVADPAGRPVLRRGWR